MHKVELEKVMSFQRGYDLTHSEMQRGNIPVVGSSSIIGYHNRAKIKSPSLVIGRSGTVGRPQYFELDSWPHNTTLFVKDFKGNIPKYCYYLLKALNLESYSTSTGVPTLNRNFIHPLKVPYHTVDEQKKIAKILSTIDQKIELNNKINAELEQMAKTLYDYWFVQFDFPNAHGKPYKSSGGAMTFNKTLNRPIPTGWEVVRLKDIMKKRTEPSEPNAKLKCIDLSVMPSSSLSINEHSSGDTFNSNMKKMHRKDILFGSIRPYLKKAGIAPFDGLRAGTVHAFAPTEDKDHSLALTLLTSERFFQYAISRSGGSTRMPSISADDILDYSLAYNEDISEKYNNLVEKFTEKIIHNIEESQNLAHLRDWLLPMLMNGQVRVGDMPDER